MPLIPLFDPKENERREMERDNAKKEGFRIKLFPEGALPANTEGNWLPQDSCGGQQWNAKKSRWEIVGASNDNRAPKYGQNKQPDS